MEKKEQKVAQPRETLKSALRSWGKVQPVSEILARNKSVVVHRAKNKY